MGVSEENKPNRTCEKAVDGTVESLPTARGEKDLASWDELDRLVDQLRSMANLLQCAQIPWSETPMLTPYMQIMDDMLTRVNHLHQSLRQSHLKPSGEVGGGLT